MTIELNESTLEETQLQIEQHFLDTEESLRPVFYATGGSYLHGIPDAHSDIDVRGFHCADGKRYMLFDTPDPQVRVTLEPPAAGTEIELVSHELRHFGHQLLSYQFNVVEPLLTGTVILAETPHEISALRSVVSGALPGSLPNRYRGMSQSVYRQYIAPDAPDRENATAKHFLHSLRGSLSAQYVLENGAIEPDLMRLARSLLERDEFLTVEQLIQAKRHRSQRPMDTDTRKQNTVLIRRLLDDTQSVAVSESVQSSFQAKLEDVILSIRTETGTA